MCDTSEMRYFDSRETAITVRHVMASGALPPAFPAVRIDGELYWDGGILSNTPTEAIFDDNPRRNSLIFAVHMWNPMGAGAGDASGRCSTVRRTSSIRAASRVTLRRQRQMHRLRHVVIGAGQAHSAASNAKIPSSRIWPNMAA